MPLFISASLIEDFLSCERKAYYRINRPDVSIQNREMVLGDIVHKTLERHWNDSKNALSYCIDEVSRRIPDDKSALKFSSDCVQTFFHSFRQYLSDEDSVEKRFKIAFKPDVFIVGKMDRISNGNIFDWKTTRNPPLDISGSPQFVLYNWAYKKMYDSEPSGVYYAALIDGKIIRYRHDSFYEDILISEIIPDIVDSIKSGEFIPNGIFKKACFRCSYSSTCLKELGKNVVDSTTSS